MDSVYAATNVLKVDAAILKPPTKRLAEGGKYVESLVHVTQ